MTGRHDATASELAGAAAALAAIAAANGTERLIAQRQAWGLPLRPLRNSYLAVWTLVALVVGAYLARQLTTPSADPSSGKADWGAGILVGAVGAAVVAVVAFTLFYTGQCCWERAYRLRNRHTPWKLDTPHHQVSLEEAWAGESYYRDELTRQIPYAAGLVGWEALTEPNLAGALISLAAMDQVDGGALQPYLWWRNARETIQHGGTAWAPDRYRPVRLGTLRFTVAASLIFIIGEGLIAHLSGAR